MLGRAMRNALNEWQGRELGSVDVSETVGQRIPPHLSLPPFDTRHYVHDVINNSRGRRGYARYSA